MWVLEKLLEAEVRGEYSIARPPLAEDRAMPSNDPSGRGQRLPIQLRPRSRDSILPLAT